MILVDGLFTAGAAFTVGGAFTAGAALVDEALADVALVEVMLDDVANVEVVLDGAADVESEDLNTTIDNLSKVTVLLPKLLIVIFSVPTGTTPVIESELEVDVVELSDDAQAIALSAINAAKAKLNRAIFLLNSIPLLMD